MLSQLHPTYLENLRVDFFRARAKVDYAGFIFTIVSMSGVLSEMTVGMLNTDLFFGRVNDDHDDASKVRSR
jgi:hypothetical protein